MPRVSDRADQPGRRPLVGEVGFGSFLRAAYRAGLITQSEQLAQLRLHRCVIEALESPPRSDKAFITTMISTFAAVAMVQNPAEAER